MLTRVHAHALQGAVLTPAPVVRAGASAEERAAATAARRAHPLYSSCVLMLLTEVVNSRLFTTVREGGGPGLVQVLKFGKGSL